MKQSTIYAGGAEIPLIALDAVVVGSGCAGLNAADWLHTLGRRNIAIVTEGINMGTSRNTGSDKQTYYKLSLASDGEDSVRSLAQTLYQGGGVHGDIALCEAAGSVRSFMKLANLGVPFPTNEYGEYIGYKTDHDPRRRATSAGPLTSRYMTECLEREVRRKDIRILDGMTAIQLLVCDGEVQGLLCVDQSRLDTASRGLTVFCARNMILATGGPAACYARSVYPESQTGMTGMAIEAGAALSNLQEWQYGLASTQFRWNVSGTYQQVLPRYVSVDEKGVTREFLLDYFKNPAEALDRVFLKGYQWPFDAAKVGGSSLIDVLVYHETQALGRRVYLDYRQNPAGLSDGFDVLGGEARAYLAQSDALIGTPIERLAKMNAPAIALYRDHGIDLWEEPLEIALCAQHHNGGIAVDASWRTTVRGLYAVGEAAGTFGFARPGGAALNSTQVGALRAAESIAWDTRENSSIPEGFEALAGARAEALLVRFECALLAPPSMMDARAFGEWAAGQMSTCAAAIRDVAEMKAFYAFFPDNLLDIFDLVRAREPRELLTLLKARDMLVTQRAVLSAMLLSAEIHGSHGSALVLREEGERLAEGAPAYRFAKAAPRPENAYVHTEMQGGTPVSELRPVRGIPEADDWFETAWARYRERTKGAAWK